MSSSKSKNIIIIILALLNAILLMVVIFDKIETWRWSNAEVEALDEVLLQSGIDIDENISFNVSAPSPSVIIRDTASEIELVSKLLGDVDVSDLGGSIYFYESAVGQAILRGTGEMDLVFTGELPDIGGTDIKALVRFMQRRGVELDADSALIKQDNYEAEIGIPCVFDSYSVYNAKLNFSLSEEKLLMINGTMVFDGQRIESDDTVMDCVSALMRFVEIVHDEGFICSRITGVEAGYFMSVSSLGECSLSPVWNISTDTGSLYINAVSGKIETLST